VCAPGVGTFRRGDALRKLRCFQEARPPLDTEEAKQLTRSTPTPFPSSALCWNAAC